MSRTENDLKGPSFVWRQKGFSSQRRVMVTYFYNDCVVYTGLKSIKLHDQQLDQYDIPIFPLDRIMFLEDYDKHVKPF